MGDGKGCNESATDWDQPGNLITEWPCVPRETLGEAHFELDMVMFSSRSLQTITVTNAEGSVKLRPTRKPCTKPLGKITSNRMDLNRILQLSQDAELEDALRWIRTDLVSRELKAHPDFLAIQQQQSAHVSRHMLKDMDDLIQAKVFKEARASRQRLGTALFKVPKDDKVSRLIGDLRPLNKMLPRPGKMELPTIGEVLEHLLGQNWLVQVDARSYFYQFEIHETLSEILTSKVGDARGRFMMFAWLVMPMGFAHAPRIAQLTSRAICDLVLRRQAGILIPWVDNFLMGGKTQEDVQALKTTLLDVAREVRMELKDPENVPSRTMTCLGLALDCSHESSLDHFAELEPTFKEQLRNHMTRNICTPRDYFEFFGTLMWANYAILKKPLALWSEALQHMRHLAQQVYDDPKRWDIPAPMPENALTELRKMGALALEGRVTLADLKGKVPQQEIWTDASSHSLAWIAAKSYAQTGHEYRKIYHAEMAAAINAMIWAQEPATVSIDNTAALRAIRKGHSATHTGNEMIRFLYHNISPRANIWLRYVPSKCNRADPLTRGSSLVPRHNCIHRSEPVRLTWRGGGTERGGLST